MLRHVIAPERFFTQVSNEIIRHPRLSANAVRLLMWQLSLPESVDGPQWEEARGHALNGDADASHRLLDEARTLISRAAEHPEDEPAWRYFYDETWFALQRGMAEMHLGAWPAAIDHLTSGLAALPDDYRRDKAWYRACLAHAAAGAGEAEQSVAVALHAIPDAAVVGRPHAWNELHVTAAALLRQGAPEGQHLVAALKTHD
ncbi:hypothetical protein SNS2_2257 [Streptomyces netropsis]|uniref:Tetratricopeptide (TPR) repeat protein n=1 Tax=Streptomyces syringium TaxID=76729 RepID=A0ABS4Y5C9_9ACTN|nr:hypothetical protein [Streptomyces syringium]MBP2403991.1 tetratricopeptide (TPR) repeat protein [Streptomyces syringium]SPE53802.1 hypothetical protein SNS2_2257 [Streptomyces netropsis]